VTISVTLPEFDTDKPWGTYAPNAWQRLLLGASHALSGDIPLLHRLVFALRKPIKYGAARPFDVTIWGLRLRLLPRGNTSEVKLLFAPQFFDREELALLGHHLSPGSTFVDIGANLGVYSFWAHNCLQGQGRILAVEPDPEMRRRLAFNVATNGITDIGICPVALSDRQGTGELLVNPAQRGENTLAREEALAAGGQRTVQHVELDTLLHLLQSRGIERVDALKIDIEGHEPPVLRHFFDHAPSTLWPTVAITEHKRETFGVISTLFTSRGYRQVMQTRLNAVFQRTPV